MSSTPVAKNVSIAPVKKGKPVTPAPDAKKPPVEGPAGDVYDSTAPKPLLTRDVPGAGEQAALGSIPKPTGAFDKFKTFGTGGGGAAATGKGEAAEGGGGAAPAGESEAVEGGGGAAPAGESEAVEGGEASGTPLKSKQPPARPKGVWRLLCSPKTACMALMLSITPAAGTAMTLNGIMGIGALGALGAAGLVLLALVVSTIALRILIWGDERAIHHQLGQKHDAATTPTGDGAPGSAQ